MLSCFADEHNTLYAVVEKKSSTGATSSSIQKENEQKNDSKKERREGATAAEPTGTSATSRNVVRLIDWLVFHVVSALFQPFNSGKKDFEKDDA